MILTSVMGMGGGVLTRAVVRDWAFLPKGRTDRENPWLEVLKTPAELVAGGLEMTAPQKLAHYYGRVTPKFMLALDKGMGKTVTYLSIAMASGAQEIILLCSHNAVWAQMRELARFYPEPEVEVVRVSGSVVARTSAWMMKPPPHGCKRILITTPIGFSNDYRAGRLRKGLAESAFYICDEMHGYLRTRKSGIFAVFKKLSPSIQNAIFSTGSPASKGPQDLWPVLHLCDPKFFRSFWNYVNAFCDVEEGAWGRTIAGVRNIEGWRNTVSPYIFRREKDLVDYPPKQRQALEYELPPTLARMHDGLRKQLFLTLELEGGGTLRRMSPNTAAQMLALRKFLITPKALDERLPWGPMLETILEDFKTSEMSHTVVSTPFRSTANLIQRFFQEHKIKCWVLMGGVEAEEMDAAMKAWRTQGGVICQTIAYATSYELPQARTMYMAGCEYHPDRNLQAEDRIHRHKSVTPHPVDIYYLRGVNTYDREILRILSQNADVVHGLLDAPLGQLLC